MTVSYYTFYNCEFTSTQVSHCQTIRTAYLLFALLFFCKYPCKVFEHKNVVLVRLGKVMVVVPGMV